MSNLSYYMLLVSINIGFGFCFELLVEFSVVHSLKGKLVLWAKNIAKLRIFFLRN